MTTQLSRSRRAALAIGVVMVAAIAGGWLWVRSSPSLRVFSGHTGAVTSLAWSPDSAHLATGSRDKSVRVWNVATGETERILQRSPQGIDSVSWSPDGARIAAASGADASAIYLWNAFTGAPTGPRLSFGDDLSGIGFRHAVAFSPDSKRIAGAGGTNGAVKIWNAQSFREERELPDHEGFASLAVFSPEGRAIATADEDVVYVWDAASGEQRHVLPGDGATPEYASWSPSGDTFICGGSYSQPRLYDARTWRVLYALPRRFNSVAFSPDGAFLVAADNSQIELWDARTGKRKRVLVQTGSARPWWPKWLLRWVPALTPANGASAPRIGSAVLSPDGKQLAYATGATVRLVPVP